MTLSKLHPLSILLGIAVALGLFALTSFGTGTQGKMDKALRISLDPDPESIVQIAEGDSFTVPGGRILLIKSLGDAKGFGRAVVQVNNVPVASSTNDGGFTTLGFPVTAQSGDVVTVIDFFNDPNTLVAAGGYLAETSRH